MLAEEIEYNTMEVRYATNEEVTTHATTVLRSDKVTLFPTYKRRWSVRIRAGKVLPEIKAGVGDSCGNVYPGEK